MQIFRVAIRRLMLLCAGTFAFLWMQASADVVVPLDDTVPNWQRIKLANGTLGFVSKRWTRVIASASSPTISAATYTVDVVDVGTGLGVLVRGPDFTLVYDIDRRSRAGPDNRMRAYITAVAPTLTTIK